MKKNNKKGFTLIELVIVATIMVMIMGAILNWIRPMNKFYQRTQALSDTNDIGSMLMDYVDDELRYATNLVVLQGYQGVPRLTGQMLTDSSGNALSYGKFTNVLILDNSAIRGSRFSDYVADLTVSRRKGARGCIISALVTNDGIDTENMRCLGNEPLYNDYGCNFEASMNTLENGSCCVTVNMELTRPRREGANYVFDKFGYNQSRDFELVNVNLNTKDGMKASFFSSTGAGQALDYNTFSRAADPGTNPQATDSGMYSNDTFTYILYTKQPPVVEKVKLSLYENLGDTVPINTQQINAGSPIPSTVIDSWVSIGQSRTTEYSFVGGKWRREKFVGIKTTEGDKDIEEFRESGVLSPLSFYIRTEPEYKNDPTKYLYFKDRFDNGRNDWGEPPSFEKQRSGIWEDYHTVSGVDDGVGDANGEYTFVGWILEANYPPAPGVKPDYDDPSGSMAAGWFVNGQEYDNEATYLAVYEKKPTVTFHFEAADDSKLTAPFPAADISVRIDDEYSITTFLSETRYINITNKFESLLNEGLSFTGWTVVGSDGTDYGSLSGLDLSTLTPDETYTIIGDADSNPYPGSFLVTITIESVPSNYYHLQAGGYNYGPYNQYAESDVLILHEDGTILLDRHISSPVQYPFVEGETIKMYVFGEKARITFTQGGTIDFEEESKWTFNGTNFTRIG